MSSKIEAKTAVRVDFSIQITLNEQEAKALEAIAGYGVDSFLEVFYAKMGRHYLEPHEQGMRLLFERIRHVMPVELAKINTAKASISEALKPFK